jgi:hypothetical protein
MRRPVRGQQQMLLTSSLGISFRSSHEMPLSIRIRHLRPSSPLPFLTMCHSFSLNLGSILGSER